MICYDLILLFILLADILGTVRRVRVILIAPSEESAWNGRSGLWICSGSSRAG